MIAGKGPAPSLVLLQAQGLPADSLTSALANGGRDFFGWTHERVLLSDIFDALNLNTRATGQWKNKPPDLPYAYRPTLPKPKANPAAGAVSVRQLFGQFTTGRHGGS